MASQVVVYPKHKRTVLMLKLDMSRPRTGLTRLSWGVLQHKTQGWSFLVRWGGGLTAALAGQHLHQGYHVSHTTSQTVPSSSSHCLMPVYPGAHITTSIIITARLPLPPHPISFSRQSMVTLIVELTFEGFFNLSSCKILMSFPLSVCLAEDLIWGMIPK